jgi:hypothetical protein
LRGHWPIWGMMSAIDGWQCPAALALRGRRQTTAPPDRATLVGSPVASSGSRSKFPSAERNSNAMFLPSTLAKFTQSFPEFLLERLRVRHPYVEGAYSCWLRARREATPPPNRKPPKVISPVDRARRGPQKPTSASNCVGVAARWVGAAPGGVAMKTRRGNTTKLKRRKGATAARSRSSSATDLQKRFDQRTRERDEARKHL